MLLDFPLTNSGMGCVFQNGLFSTAWADYAERSTGCDEGQTEHKHGQVRMIQLPIEAERPGQPRLKTLLFSATKGTTEKDGQQ